jgi:sugar/nucleoside kinase (ribokinase family)
MSLLVVGSVAYDSVETPSGKVDQALGGSATFFSISASFFSPVRLVACVGNDFKAEDRFLLESRNVDLEGLEVISGETFRWKGFYGEDLNEAQTLETHLNVFAGFSPKIPLRYQSSEYVFLGNIDPHLQKNVVSQIKGPKIVACDTMNYWIQGAYDSLLETLKYVNILIINDAEAKQLTNDKSLIRAAHRILELGPVTLIVKRGEYGVTMFHRDKSSHISAFAIPAYPIADVVDPTGAGDTFAGGFMGFLAGSNRTDFEAMKQAVVFGSVMASFNVEKFSLNRLRELTFTEVQMRFKEFRQLVQFENPPDLD